jgi:hypothetical protein
MRLRPLTEAECYARCYGGHAAAERVSIVPAGPRSVYGEAGPRPTRTEAGEQLRALFDERLDARPPDEEAA